MGRRIPPYTNEPIHNPAVSVSLLIAFVAATVVVIAALCGSKAKSQRRKASKLPENTDIETPPTSRKPPPPASSPSPPSSPPPPPVEEDREQSPPMFTDLMPNENETIRRKLNFKTQRRRLSTSLSMKVGGTALAKMLSRKEEPLIKMMPSFMMRRAIDYQLILLGHHGHYQFLGPTHLLIEISDKKANVSCWLLNCKA